MDSKQIFQRFENRRIWRRFIAILFIATYLTLSNATYYRFLIPRNNWLSYAIYQAK
jgi:hypothetical protein